MDVFVTGAGGYIGGTVAARLVAAGHKVRALVRGEAKADAVRGLGMEPVRSDLDDSGLLAMEASRADIVVNAASSDHRGAALALIEGLSGSGKPLLHTSGSSVVADDAAGEPSDRVYDEATPFEPVPAKAARVAIDRLVTGARERGVRSVVLCNALIYGRGLGPNPDSVQVPVLARRARETGVARHVGRGLNVWSNVHVLDVADLYLLALERAEAGSFLFVENGEASFLEVTAAIAAALGVRGPAPWPVEEAIAELGREKALYTFGSNSRVRARAARALGWAPRHSSVVDWIATGGLSAGDTIRAD